MASDGRQHIEVRASQYVGVGSAWLGEVGARIRGDGVLEPLFKDNGLGDVKTEAVRAPLVVSSASDALQLLQEAAGAYRAVVADLSDAERSKAWGEVYECLKQFEAGRGFQTQLELIVGPGARLSKF
jgi:hypothetical protein